jgi:hypothetical protein
MTAAIIAGYKQRYKSRPQTAGGHQQPPPHRRRPQSEATASSAIRVGGAGAPRWSTCSTPCGGAPGVEVGGAGAPLLRAATRHPGTH